MASTQAWGVNSETCDISVVTSDVMREPNYLRLNCLNFHILNFEMYTGCMEWDEKVKYLVHVDKILALYFFSLRVRPERARNQVCKIQSSLHRWAWWKRSASASPAITRAFHESCVPKPVSCLHKTVLGLHQDSCCEEETANVHASFKLEKKRGNRFEGEPESPIAPMPHSEVKFEENVIDSTMLAYFAGLSEDGLNELPTLWKEMYQCAHYILIVVCPSSSTSNRTVKPVAFPWISSLLIYLKATDVFETSKTPTTTHFLSLTWKQSLRYAVRCYDLTDTRT